MDVRAESDVYLSPDVCPAAGCVSCRWRYVRPVDTCPGCSGNVSPNVRSVVFSLKCRHPVTLHLDALFDGNNRLCFNQSDELVFSCDVTTARVHRRARRLFDGFDFGKCLPHTGMIPWPSMHLYSEGKCSIERCSAPEIPLDLSVLYIDQLIVTCMAQTTSQFISSPRTDGDIARGSAYS